MHTPMAPAVCAPSIANRIAGTVERTFRLQMTGSRRAMAARSSGARNLISTMPSGSSTPPRAPVSAYISTCVRGNNFLNFLAQDTDLLTLIPVSAYFSTCRQAKECLTSLAQDVHGPQCQHASPPAGSPKARLSLLAQDTGVPMQTMHSCRFAARIGTRSSTRTSVPQQSWTAAAAARQHSDFTSSLIEAVIQPTRLFCACQTPQDL